MITLIGLGVLGTRVLRLLSEYEKITIIDYDFVEEHNVPNQYPHVAVGMRKVDAAKEMIRGDVQVLHKHIDWSTVGLLHDSEVIIDCTDNMIARYVINDYCSKNGIPWIHAGLSDSIGTVASILPEGPCYQCIYPRGKAEYCGPELELEIADTTAVLVAQELKRLKSNPRSRFIRVTSDGTGALETAHRSGCLTCQGKYHYLEPRDYYITYCTTNNCMSAKPVKPVHNDLGPSKDIEIDGFPVKIFANGEIHFLRIANDDELHIMADYIYKKFRN